MYSIQNLFLYCKPMWLSPLEISTKSPVYKQLKDKELDKNTEVRNKAKDPYIDDINNGTLDLASDVLKNGSFWYYIVGVDNNGKYSLHEGFHRHASLKLKMEKDKSIADYKIFCLVFDDNIEDSLFRCISNPTMFNHNLTIIRKRENDNLLVTEYNFGEFHSDVIRNITHSLFPLRDIMYKKNNDVKQFKKINDIKYKTYWEDLYLETKKNPEMIFKQRCGTYEF